MRKPIFIWNSLMLGNTCFSELNEVWILYDIDDGFTGIDKLLTKFLRNKYRGFSDPEFYCSGMPAVQILEERLVPAIRE